MKSAGCYLIDLGLESASPRVLKVISKGISPEQVKDLLHWEADLDILVKLFVAWEYPTETYKEAKKNITIHQDP